MKTVLAKQAVETESFFTYTLVLTVLNFLGKNKNTGRKNKKEKTKKKGRKNYLRKGNKKPGKKWLRGNMKNKRRT